MQNDEKTLDTQEVQQESEAVAVESTETEQPEVETQSESTEDTVESRLAKAEAEAAKFRRLFEKSQKQVTKPVAKEATQSVSPQLNVEEAVLQANGMSDELLTELKAVAKVRGLSLIKAQNDPIFVAVKEKFEQDKKQKDASLPASRGSGVAKPKKDLTTPGLSREEHRKLALGL